MRICFGPRALTVSQFGGRKYSCLHMSGSNTVPMNSWSLASDLNVVQGDRDAYMLRAQSVDGVPIWRQKVLLSPYVGLEYRAHEFLELAAHTRDRVHRVADGRDDSDLHRERLARCRSESSRPSATRW